MIKGSTFSRLLHVSFVVLAMSQAALAQDTGTETESEAPTSITLTLPDGSKTTLLVDTIRRIRKAVSPETQSGAKTRIDWLQLLLVRESPEDVAALVEQSVPSLAKLRMPEGSPIWFRGGIAQGPMPLTRDQLKNGVRSAIVLGDSMQFLSSTPEEVRQELADKGGNALPEPQAVASLSPQGQKGSKPAQKPQESQEQVQVAAQTVQPSQEQIQRVGEIIRLQQAQAAPAEQIVQQQQAQAEPAPQLVQPQQEPLLQVGEIIRLQQVQAQPAPQLAQLPQEQAEQVGEIIRLQPAQAEPVGQIIRLQQARAEPAPQLVQPQQEKAEQVGEIIRLQPAQAEPVGQIIRLQQAQAEQAQPSAKSTEEPLEWLDGFSELADRAAQGRQASKRDQRTAEDVQRVKQAQRISRGL
jgi:hypothetical protein